MNVSTTREADTAIGTLDPEDRIKMSEWIHQLGNWETDERLRTMARPTVVRGTYALHTTDDLRIFFALDEATKQIVVVDLAKPSRYKFAATE